MARTGRDQPVTSQRLRGWDQWLAVGLWLGLTACGSPAPEAPGLVAGSVSAPTPSVENGRVGIGLTTLPTPRLDPLSPDASRVTSKVSAPPAASTADRLVPDEETSATQAQRDAWTQWYATARESPEVSVRLQTLEQWAQQPQGANDSLDPVTYALVDEDDAVRARAQALYEQQLVREATAAAPSEPETKDP